MRKIKLSLLDEKTLAIEVLDPQALNQVRTLPGQRKFVSRFSHWEVLVCDENIQHLLSVFERDEVDCTEEAALVLKYVELRTKRSEARAERRWEFLFEGTVPEIEYEPVTDMYKHQLVALDAIHNTEFFALFMDMGTGKTKIVLDEIRWMHLSAPDLTRRILVVAPAGVCRNWPAEIKKHWGDTVNYEGWVLDLGERGFEQLIECARSKAKIKLIICSYERARIFKEHLLRFKWALMILDESARIKNPYAQRTKACIEIASMAADRRLALTGTPVLNNVHDVWAQFEFLSPGILGFGSYHAFINAHPSDEVRTVKDGKVVVQNQVRGADALKAKMARYSFVVKKEQCLDLPEKMYQRRIVTMGKKQAELYEQMLQWCIASLNEIDPMDPRASMKATAVIAQITRLRQIAGGFIVPEEGPVKYIEDATGKSEQLLEDLDELEGKAIIWRAFRADDALIEKAITASGRKFVKIVGGMSMDDRQAAQEAFNDDDSVTCLIGSPEAAGEGITLLGSKECRCATAIYWSNSFSLGPRLQSEDRCHRIGQDRGVNILDYATEDTIEEGIMDALQEKKDLSQNMTNVHSIRDMLMAGRMVAAR